MTIRVLFLRLLIKIVVVPMILAACGFAAAADRDQLIQAARSEVKSGNHEAALSLLRTLMHEDPGNIEATTWVARLESWKGNYRIAEELYRRVLENDPDHLEAAVGLADVMSWEGRFAEATEILNHLRRNGSNSEIILRLARISQMQGRRREALQLYEQALITDPTNHVARGAIQQLRAQTPFRFEIGYLLEAFSFHDNSNGASVELMYRGFERLRLVTVFSSQSKFQQRVTRISAGATLRVLPRSWVRSEFSWSLSSDTVTSRRDWTLEWTQGVTRNFALGTGYRSITFGQAIIRMPIASANWDPRANVHFHLRYTPAQTDLQNPSIQPVWNHSGSGRLVWDINRIASPYVLFAVGAENFISTDQLGHFAAQTYGLGTEIRFTPSQGARVGYAYQNRTQRQTQQVFGLSYFVGF